MPRTIIDLPEKQIREIDTLCRTLGISRAEAVRRALDGFLSANHDVRSDGFGLWRDVEHEQRH